MQKLFPDRLLDAIAAKRSPICVGIDPIYASIPDAIAGESSKRNANDREAAIDAIFEFTTQVLRIVAPYVPCVKFQSAYFEQYMWEGVEAYYSLIQEAMELGLLVIGDVKRGDIGSTAAAYAEGHLAEPSFADDESLHTPDAITVNPYLGLDTLEPFITAARSDAKGIFVLVRTSNPGSADLQDARLDDGRTFSEMLADRLATLAEQPGLVGSSGYSAIGAVVGATQPHTMKSLRARLPRSILLLPGYGTQGATGEMTQAAFTSGRGAIVSASRSILYAHKDAKYSHLTDWKQAVESAVLAMKEDVGRFL
jgi:orotidine-5'-phosphate decarboxylase